MTSSSQNLLEIFKEEGLCSHASCWEIQPFNDIKYMLLTEREVRTGGYFMMESVFFDVPRAVYHIKFLNTN